MSVVELLERAEVTTTCGDEWARTLEAAVVAAVTRSESASWDLGERFVDFDESAAWQELGFESFRQWCEERLEFTYEKARYLLRTVGWFRAQSLGSAEVAEMGITKAKALVGIVTRENYAEWAERCRSMGKREIEELVRRARRGEDIGESRRRAMRELQRLTFTVDADGANLVREAVASARGEMEREQGHDVADGEALVAIVGEWWAACGGGV